MYGLCAECGFPVSIKNSHDRVSCPFCATVNQPISDTAGGTLITVLVAGVFLAIAIGSAVKSHV